MTLPSLFFFFMLQDNTISILKYETSTFLSLTLPSIHSTSCVRFFCVSGGDSLAYPPILLPLSFSLAITHAQNTNSCTLAWQDQLLLIPSSRSSSPSLSFLRMPRLPRAPSSSADAPSNGSCPARLTSRTSTRSSPRSSTRPPTRPTTTSLLRGRARRTPSMASTNAVVTSRCRIVPCASPAQ